MKISYDLSPTTPLGGDTSGGDRPGFPLGWVQDFTIWSIERGRGCHIWGSLRESVLILEANMNSQLLALLARLSTGIRFKVRDIYLMEDEDGWELSMVEQGTELYQAFISKSWIKDALPAGSLFTSANEADAFLLGVSYGGGWKPKTGRLRLLAETHDPWKALAGRCDTTRFDFYDGYGYSSVTHTTRISIHLCAQDTK